MTRQRAIRVGDRVRQRGRIYTLGTVERLIRGTELYFRRAEVIWDDGRKEVVRADTLVLDPEPYRVLILDEP